MALHWCDWWLWSVVYTTIANICAYWKRLIMNWYNLIHFVLEINLNPAFRFPISIERATGCRLIEENVEKFKICTDQWWRKWIFRSEVFQNISYNFWFGWFMVIELINKAGHYEISPTEGESIWLFTGLNISLGSVTTPTHKLCTHLQRIHKFNSIIFLLSMGKSFR